MKSDIVKNGLNDIAYRLVSVRKKNGFATSEEFAGKHGLPPLMYRGMEHGMANITIASLLKVLEIHNLTVEQFFCSDIEKVAA